MKICTIYGNVSDKIKSVIFAKRIAEEEAKEAQRKKIVIICVCAGIALVAAAVAVAIYFLSKKESVRNRVNVIVTNIKSKLPSKKSCEDVCEVEEADIVEDDVADIAE